MLKIGKLLKMFNILKNFFTIAEEFQGIEIDQDKEETIEVVEINGSKDSIANLKIFQLKDNIFPKGLIPLERLSNPNDVAVDSGKVSQDEHIQDHNVGTQEKLRMNCFS